MKTKGIKRFQDLKLKYRKRMCEYSEKNEFKRKFQWIFNRFIENPVKNALLTKFSSSLFNFTLVIDSFSKIKQCFWIFYDSWHNGRLFTYHDVIFLRHTGVKKDVLGLNGTYNFLRIFYRTLYQTRFNSKDVFSEQP